MIDVCNNGYVPDILHVMKGVQFEGAKVRKFLKMKRLDRNRFVQKTRVQAFGQDSPASFSYGNRLSWGKSDYANRKVFLNEF